MGTSTEGCCRGLGKEPVNLLAVQEVTEEGRRERKCLRKSSRNWEKDSVNVNEEHWCANVIVFSSILLDKYQDLYELQRR